MTNNECITNVAQDRFNDIIDILKPFPALNRVFACGCGSPVVVSSPRPRSGPGCGSLQY